MKLKPNVKKFIHYSIYTDEVKGFDTLEDAVNDASQEAIDTLHDHVVYQAIKYVIPPVQKATVKDVS